MKQFFKISYRFILSGLLVHSGIINADCAALPAFTTLQDLCTSKCCVAGTFTIDDGQIVMQPGSQFCVQRIANGLFSVTLKQPFCCRITVIAKAEKDCTFTSPAASILVQKGILPSRLAVSKDSACLAVSNNMSNNISVFPITGCSLGTETAYNTGLNPLGLAYSNSCLAVANNGEKDETTTLFAVGKHCKLTPIGSFPNPSSSFHNPRTVTFSPNGDCIAVSTRTNIGFITANAFTGSVDDSCNLTSDEKQLQILWDPDVTGQPTLFLSDECIATINAQGDPQIEFQSIASNCSHTPASTPVKIGIMFPKEKPVSMALSRENKCLSVLADNNKIYVFNVKDDCSAEQISLSPFTINNPTFVPQALDYSPDGSCLAVVSKNTAGKGNVTIFNVDSSNCRLTPIGGTTIDLPDDAVAPTDIKFLSQNCIATANASSNNISILSNLLPVIVCEAMTTSCFILQLQLPDGQSDDNITVNFFVTQCT